MRSWLAVAVFAGFLSPGALVFSPAEATAQALWNHAERLAVWGEMPVVPAPAHSVPDTTIPPPQRLSIGGAFLRSALIPGWGQRAAGSRTAARNFFVTDATLWFGMIAFHVYGGWLKQDYRLLAAEHAGADLAGKSDKFFVDMSNYASLEAYNQSRLQRRDVQALYDPATHSWRWDSESNRVKYDRLRLRSDRAYSRSELVVAAILANHIISGVHAAWLAHRNASRAGEAPPGRVHPPQLGVSAGAEEWRLTLQMQF